MKHLFVIFTFLVTMLSSGYAKQVKINLNVDDSAHTATVVTSHIADSDSIDEDSLEDVINAATSKAIIKYDSRDSNFELIPLVGIIMGCGLPVFIIAIIMWFRYKNKQAKYRLVSEALAAGKELPKDLFAEALPKEMDILNKGIKNVFLGIGLGVFLWVLTDEEGLAAIGFLIFCMGLGQVIIGYTNQPKKHITDNNLSDNKKEEE